MQVDTAVRITAVIAIFEVPFYGASQGRQLRPDLMVSAGMQVNFQEEIAIQPFPNSINQPGLLTSGYFVGMCVRFILFGISFQPVYEGIRCFGRLILD